MSAPLAVHNRKGVSAASTWFFDEHIEDVQEEAQMPTGDKIDLNSAIVVRACMCVCVCVVVRFSCVAFLDAFTF